MLINKSLLYLDPLSVLKRNASHQLGHFTIILVDYVERREFALNSFPLILFLLFFCSLLAANMVFFIDEDFDHSFSEVSNTHPLYVICQNITQRFDKQKVRCSCLITCYFLSYLCYLEF